MRRNSYLLIVGIVATAGCDSPGSPAAPDVMPSPVLGLQGGLESPPLSGVGTATIDGVLEPGEWDNASEVLITGDGPNAGTTLYVMNDENSVYFALKAADPTMSGCDALQVRFDNANDGAWDLNEDEICANAPPSDWHDCHSYEYNGEPAWGMVDAHQDGSKAVSSDGTWNIFEVARPLSSGDPHDFSLSHGDIVGFCAAYYVEDYWDYRDYPLNCIYVGADLTGYAKLKIAFLSAEQVIRRALDEVAALEELGTLGRGQVTVLTRMLETTLADMAAGSSKATNYHAAFARQVNAFGRAGHLTQEQAQGLLDLASEALNFLST